MSRGFGEVELLQELIPTELAVLVALITQLGDVWFVALLLAVLYWTRGRESIAIVVARAMGGLGLLYAFKYSFSLQRPDQPLVELEVLPWFARPVYELTGFAGGYGFPSGHALVTTVVYVSLAGALSVGTGRQRYAFAAAVVTMVGLSRVALGVHYLVDVVAGVALGLAYVVGSDLFSDRFPNERATATFALAVAFSIAGVLASGFAFDQLLVLAVSLGGLGGWATYRLLEAPAGLDRRAVGHLGAVAVAFGPLLASVLAFGVVSAPGSLSLAGFATAVLIAVPIVTRPGRLRRITAFVAFCAAVVAWNVRSLVANR